MDFLLSFWQRFTAAISRLFGEMTTEENLYQMLRSLITQQQIEELEKLVVESIKIMAEKNHLTNEQKRARVHALVVEQLEAMGDNMRQHVTDSVINFLIEKFFTKLKLEVSNS